LLSFDSNSITVIDSAKNTVLHNFGVGNKPIAAVVSRNDKKLYVANEGDNTLQVIDTSNYTTLKTIPLGQRPTLLRLTIGGRLYVMSSEGKTVQTFDTKNDQPLFTVNTDPNASSGAPTAMSHTAEQYLSVGAEDGDIYTWNVTNPNEISAPTKTVVDRSAAKIKRKIRALDSLKQVTYAALDDGDVLVLGSTTGNADQQTIISTNTTPTGLNIGNDLKTATVTNSKANTVAVITTADNKVTYIDVGAKSLANGQFISAPSFQFAQPTYIQEEENNTYAWNLVKVQIQRTGNIGGMAKVHYQTESGSAFTKWDFLETKGDVEFQDGEVAKEITIQVIGDTTVEDYETFTVKISEPTDGYNTGPQDHTEITLANDDSLPTSAGCAIGGSQDFDPLLPLLVSGAAACVMMRRRSKT
jgi:YVTN family beta-propeller protein